MHPGAPGHECWGEIVELGPGVSGMRVGDCATGLMWNGFAELGVARAENLLLVSGPGPLLGEPLACAMNVVRRAAPAAGDRIAIVGFGYLAALIVQLLPRHVAGWIAVSRREDSRALAMQLGAEAALDFSEIPSTAWDSFPMVIECAGVQQTLDYATWLTAYGGKLVIAGYHADGPRTVNMQSWNWKGIDVLNAHARAPSVYMSALHGALEQLHGRGMRDLLTHEFALNSAADAFVTAEMRPAGYIKAVMRP
jgi:threonine dehydrogenase-like Zn-dependent dehydrogenase